MHRRRNTQFEKLARPCVLVLCTLLGFGVAGVQQAHAGFFHFSTTTTINPLSPPLLPAGSIIGANGTAAVTNLTPGATLITMLGNTVADAGDNIDATGTGSDIVFGNITVPVTKTTPLETVSIPYTFHITVTDYATDSSLLPLGSVIFDIAGTLSGTVGAGKKVNLSTNLFSPGNILSKTINDQLYTLSLNSVVPPGPSNAGAFGTHVVARTIPEPSSFALIGLGMLCLAAPAWRRLRGMASSLA